FLGYLMARRRLPWSVVLVGLPLLLFIIMPVLSVYKYTSQDEHGVRSTDNQTLDVQFTADRTLQRLGDRGRARGFEIGLHRLLARTCSADGACRYIHFYPHVYDFEGGKSFVAATAGLIPRVFWPEKPNLSAVMDGYAAKIGILGAVGA